MLPLFMWSDWKLWSVVIIIHFLHLEMHSFLLFYRKLRVPRVRALAGRFSQRGLLSKSHLFFIVQPCDTKIIIVILEGLQEVILFLIFRLMRYFCHDVFESRVMVIRQLGSLIKLWLLNSRLLLKARRRFGVGNADGWHRKLADSPIYLVRVQSTEETFMIALLVIRIGLSLIQAL